MIATLPQPLKDYLAAGDGPEPGPLWTPADHNTWDDDPRDDEAPT